MEKKEKLRHSRPHTIENKNIIKEEVRKRQRKERGWVEQFQHKSNNSRNYNYKQ